MANICDNSLTLTVKHIPSWFKPFEDDKRMVHPFTIVYKDNGLFLWDSKVHECEWEQTDDWLFIQINFETKWAPPTELYEDMMKDDNIISFHAQYYEPGCSVLGYANKYEGIVEEECPRSFYSDTLSLDVLMDNPPQTYLDMNGTDLILADEYRERMYIIIEWAKQAQSELDEFNQSDMLDTISFV